MRSFTARLNALMLYFNAPLQVTVRHISIFISCKLALVCLSCLSCFIHLYFIHKLVYLFVVRPYVHNSLFRFFIDLYTYLFVLRSFTSSFALSSSAHGLFFRKLVHSFNKSYSVVYHIVTVLILKAFFRVLKYHNTEFFIAANPITIHKSILVSNKPVEVGPNTAGLQFNGLITAHDSFTVASLQTIVSCPTQKCLRSNQIRHGTRKMKSGAKVPS